MLKFRLDLADKLWDSRKRQVNHLPHTTEAPMDILCLVAYCLHLRDRYTLRDAYLYATSQIWDRPEAIDRFNAILARVDGHPSITRPIP